jgi:hypothetical protein
MRRRARRRSAGPAAVQCRRCADCFKSPWRRLPDSDEAVRAGRHGCKDSEFRLKLRLTPTAEPPVSLEAMQPMVAIRDPVPTQPPKHKAADARGIRVAQDASVPCSCLRCWPGPGRPGHIHPCGTRPMTCYGK